MVMMQRLAIFGCFAFILYSCLYFPWTPQTYRITESVGRKMSVLRLRQSLNNNERERGNNKKKRMAQLTENERWRTKIETFPLLSYYIVQSFFFFFKNPPPLFFFYFNPVLCIRLLLSFLVRFSFLSFFLFFKIQIINGRVR